MQRLFAFLLSTIALLLATQVYRDIRSTAAPAFTTPYQAVVLTGGQVYYGKLENVSGLYPVLRDVFYVITKENPETKQVTNILVRRGKELHGPDYMVLNRTSILFAEPVGKDSEIAKSILAQSSQGR